MLINKLMHKRLFIALHLLFPLLGETALAQTQSYITDIIVVPIYQSNAAKSQIIGQLPTGTKLYVINETETMSEVKMDNGLQGWVEKQYLTHGIPLGDIVSQLATDNAKLKAKLEQFTNNPALQKIITQLETLPESSSAIEDTEIITRLNQQNADLTQQLDIVNQETKTLRIQLNQLRNQTASHIGATTNNRPENLNTIPRVLLGLSIGMPLGVIVGLFGYRKICAQKLSSIKRSNHTS